MPDDGSALDAFVRGAFRRAISERLGEDVAEGVLQELWPMLAMLTTRRPRSVTPRAKSAVGSVPRPSPLPSQTARPPNVASLDDDDPSGIVMVVGPTKTVRAGESLPIVVAVMREGARHRELALRLAGRALIRPVADLMEMSEAIEDHRADRPVVLFDCVDPPFHLESVATFASELPCGSWLALLDASEDDDRTARSFAGTTLTVARISSRGGLDDVARACLALFD